MHLPFTVVADEFGEGLVLVGWVNAGLSEADGEIGGRQSCDLLECCQRRFRQGVNGNREGWFAALLCAEG